MNLNLNLSLGAKRTRHITIVFTATGTDYTLSSKAFVVAGLLSVSSAVISATLDDTEISLTAPIPDDDLEHTLVLGVRV